MNWKKLMRNTAMIRNFWNGTLYGSAIRDTPDDNGGGIHPGNPDSGNRSQ